MKAAAPGGIPWMELFGVPCVELGLYGFTVPPPNGPMALPGFMACWNVWEPGERQAFQAVLLDIGPGNPPKAAGPAAAGGGLVGNPSGLASC